MSFKNRLIEMIEVVFKGKMVDAYSVSLRQAIKFTKESNSIFLNFKFNASRVIPYNKGLFEILAT